MPDPLFESSAGMKPDPEPAKKKDEEKKEEKPAEQEKKPDAAAVTPDEVPEEVKNHPAYKAMAAKVDESGNNLKNQGDIIADKNRRIAELTKSAPIDESKLPFTKEQLKTSKDLTQAEKDDMTEREIKMFDERADERRKANERAEADIRKTMVDELSKDEAKLPTPSERKGIIETEVKALAGDDSEKERELKEAVSMLDFADLTGDQIRERVKKAQMLLPSFRAPKEQESGKGGAIKTGKAEDGSAEAVADRVIAEVETKNKGDYEL